MGLQDVILGRSSEIGLISLAGWSDTCEDVAGVLFYLDKQQASKVGDVRVLLFFKQSRWMVALFNFNDILQI